MVRRRVLRMSLCLWVAVGVLASGCSRKKAETCTVTITGPDGATQRLEKFQQTIVGYALSSTRIVGIPEVVETAADWVDVRAIGPSMPYDLRVPLAILKEVTFEPGASDDWNRNDYLLVGATLGDGVLLKGSGGGIFEGQGSLGKATYRIERFEFREKGVRRIAFEGSAKPSHAEAAWGSHTVVLHKLDGTRVTVEQATFVKDRWNKNGCWTGDEPAESMDFESSGAAVEVPWKKIQAIVPSQPGDGDPGSSQLTLVTTDGSQLKGSCPPYLQVVSTIRGLVPVGEHYKLLADIRLRQDGKPVFARLELK